MAELDLKINSSPKASALNSTDGDWRQHSRFTTRAQPIQLEEYWFSEEEWPRPHMTPNAPWIVPCTSRCSVHGRWFSILKEEKEQKGLPLNALTKNSPLKIYPQIIHPPRTWCYRYSLKTRSCMGINPKGTAVPSTFEIQEKSCLFCLNPRSLIICITHLWCSGIGEN